MATLTDNGTGVFTGPMPTNTFDLVIGDGQMGEYLQEKIGSLIGKSPDEILLGTPMTISSTYHNSEGVINRMKGKTGFVKGLRIDLQKAQTHNDIKYATFQVQWGTGMNGRDGGAYAGALMRVDTRFGVGDLREALRRSNKTQTYWRIDP